MPFTVHRLDIPELLLIEPGRFEDGRGFFMETYKHSNFLVYGIDEHFVQDNYSRSARGVLRGLHYQKNPHAQGKLVQCIKGAIFDVAVDIRRASPTYMRWVSIELTEEDTRLFYIPPGFAHGFLALSDVADVIYKCTGEYSAGHDRGIIWNDPDLQISWPVEKPVLSEKDSRHPFLRDADNNFVYRE
jgi:dTDP-4-dehydrorhamnose 3,5-epimerase